MTAHYGDIEDRVVMIVGAAGPIGAAVTDAFLQYGARTAVADLPGPAFTKMRDRLSGGPVLAAALDAADAVQTRQFVANVTDVWGGVDVLVNAAGSWTIVDFTDSGPAQWERMIQANLYTTFASCHAVLPGMLTAGRGAIVNFASTAGEYGSIRPSAAYAAAKGGVIAFTKSLAREVSAAGVRVNAVSPGPIDTAMLKADDDASRAEVRARTLLGRPGRPDEIAEAVLFLAGSSSSFITGHVLRVNGGSLL